MLMTTIDEQHAIATLHPEGVLTEKDFDQAAQIIDPYIEQRKKLNGLIIYTESFPGWDSFSSLIRHLKFINNHHKKVKHLAFVTDSTVGKLAEKIGNHFVAAEIRTFAFKELEEATKWVLEGN